MTSPTNVTDLADQLFDPVVDLVIEVNEMAIRTARMRNALDQTEADATNIAAAATELAGSARNLGTNVSGAASSAAQARRQVEQARADVNLAREQMHQIEARVTDTRASVDSLSEASREVGDILSTINEIARQTRLLALNATIEAARAGEAGKGFGVVAAEVKALSTETGRAIVHIHQRIERIQNEIQQIDAQVGRVSEAVERGEESMAAVNEGASALETSVTEVDRQMAEAQAIVEEQLLATENIAEGINGVSQLSSQNTETVRETNEALGRAEKLSSAQIQLLSAYEMPDRVLRIARADHVLWKKRLVDMMDGKTSLRPEELSSHRHCRLGKWYLSDASQALHHLPEWEELDLHHQRVHDSGIAAAQAMQDHDRQAAVGHIAGMESASDDVLRLLERLRVLSNSQAVDAKAG